MKVLGLAKENYDTEYICIITHKEIEQFLGLYYKSKMPGLKVGDEVDLGQGYNFCRDTIEALKSTQQFLEKNKSVVEAIINGINIIELQRKGEEEL